MGYWVARRHNGAQVRESSIGPDTAGIRAQVERLWEEARRHQAWSAVTRANVRILKQSGVPAPDRTTGSLLSAIARTGFFEHGGVLIGTQAFRHYPLMLGKLAPRSALARTGDVDLLVSNCVRLAGGAQGLAVRIEEIGIDMQPVFGLDDSDPAKWRVNGELDLAFLSPVARGGQTVSALRHLDYLIAPAETAISLYRSGIRIRVPAPARYALHKLIVAQLRGGAFRTRRERDLCQAEWIILSMLDDRSFELWQAWSDLARRGPNWRALARKSLATSAILTGAIKQLEAEFGPAILRRHRAMLPDDVPGSN